MMICCTVLFVIVVITRGPVQGSAVPLITLGSANDRISQSLPVQHTLSTQLTTHSKILCSGG